MSDEVEFKNGSKIAFTGSLDDSYVGCDSPTKALRPCPFCQSKDVAGKYAMDEFNYLGTAYIVCMRCRARGPYEYGEQLARDAWNKRA